MHLTKTNFGEITFEDVKKDERTYSVKFADRVHLQTKRSTMMSPSLVDSENDIVPFIQVDLDGETADVLRSFESFIKESTKERKSAWFKKTISDAYLDSSFKTYFKDAPTQAAFKISDDFVLFDVDGNVIDPSALVQGRSAIFLFETAQITFGKTEYGCLWKAKQAVLIPAKAKPECLIQVTDDEETNPRDDDNDEDYFL